MILTVAAPDGLALPVLDSLPAHFRRTTGPADVAVLTGPGAVPDGTRGVLAAGPVDSLAVPAVADVGFAYDPAWTRALPRLREDVAGAAVLDSLAHGAAPIDLLAGQLALLRPLLSEVGALRAVHRTAGQYAVCGQVGGLVINLAGAAHLPGAPALSVQLASLDVRWTAAFDTTAVATPTVITRSDAHGDLRVPLVYESSSRHAWLALHAAVTAGALVPYGPADLAADRRLAADLLESR